MRQEGCAGTQAAHRRTKVEPNSGSSGNDEWFKHKTPRISHNVLFELLILGILILQRGEGRVKRGATTTT